MAPKHPPRGTIKATQDESGLAIDVVADGQGGWLFNGGDWEEKATRDADEQSRHRSRWLADANIVAPSHLRSFADRKAYKDDIKRQMRRFYRTGALSRELQNHIALKVDNVADQVSLGAPERDRYGRIVSYEPEGAGIEVLRRRFKVVFPQLPIELPINTTGGHKGQVSKQALRDALRLHGWGWCSKDCTGRFPAGHPTKLGVEQTDRDTYCRAARKQADRRRRRSP